ncbi:MAG TPA: hypothetical protein VJ803_08490, partial [Gemmatimonadaceae bacterium]|nr:hypothetical protein [Gemmatimonadaceae bacterium]
MTPTAPHGGALVDRVLTGHLRAALAEQAERLPAITLDEWEAADVEMIATGALSPLTGFMGRSDYVSTLRDMRLANGLPWTIPITLRLQSPPARDRVALRAPDGTLLGILEVKDVYTT